MNTESGTISSTCFKDDARISVGVKVLGRIGRNPIASENPTGILAQVTSCYTIGSIVNIIVLLCPIEILR